MTEAKTATRQTPNEKNTAAQARDLPILIAGGGIAGLAAGLALAQVGITSRILERRTEFSEAGAGIQLSPNAVKVLRSLDVLEALIPHAGQPGSIAIRDGASSKLLHTLPLGHWLAARHGAPYLVAHRRDLQQVLLDAVRTTPLVAIETGWEAIAFEERDGGVRARSADGRETPGLALICADGVHSTLRRSLFPEQLPRFTGRTAARAVIDAKALPASTQGIVPRDATGVWLAPDSHVVHYPVRAGREIAIVVIGTEPWQGTDWSTPIPRGSVLDSLGAFSPQLLVALDAATDWRKWALFDAKPLPAWSSGRIILIGDAAHPVLPFLAQGGGLALEDAASLAHHMSASRGGLQVAFQAFARERQGRAARVLRGARRNGRIYHLSGFSAHARNGVLRFASPERLMASYDWLYGWSPPALGSA